MAAVVSLSILTVTHTGNNAASHVAISVERPCARDGGAENAGRENDGREIDGPICRA